MPVPTEAFVEVMRAVSSSKILFLKIRELFDPESWGVIEKFASPDRVFSTHHMIGEAFNVVGDELVPTAAYYRPIIKSANMVRSRVAGGRIRGRTEPDSATVVLLNDGEISSLSDVPRETEASLYLTSRRLGASDALEVFAGVVDQISPSRDGSSVTLAMKSADLGLSKPLNFETWMGFGPSLDFETRFDQVVFEHDAAFDLDGPFTVEVVARLGHWETEDASDLRMVAGRNGVNGPFQVSYDESTSKWQFTCWDSIGGSMSVFYDQTPEAANVVDRQWLTFSIVYDELGLVVYRDGVEIGSADLPVGWTGTLASSSEPLYLGYDTNELSFRGSLAEFRIFSVARSAEKIRQWARKPMSGDEDDLVLLAKLNESNGDATWDDERGFKGAISGCVWGDSYTGDPELSGKRKPTSWGLVWHREAHRIASASRLWSAHCRGADCKVLRVFEGGAARIPTYSTSLGATTHDAERGRISLDVGAGLPGLAKFVPGQTVVIASGLNAGQWTVRAVDEISGNWIDVVETLTSGTQAGPVSYSTKDGTEEWIDGDGLESFGMWRMLADTSKPVTCRILGERHPTMGSSAPGLMIAMAKSVNPNLSDGHFDSTFSDVSTENPFLCQYATGESGDTVDLAWSKLASSVGANFGAFGQVFSMAVFQPPGEYDPETTPTDPSVLSIGEGDSLKLEWLRRQPAIGKARVLYRRNFRKMSEEELVGSVLEDDTAEGREHLQYLLGESLSVETVGPDPLALDEDELDSLLVQSRAAGIICDRNFDIYSVPREGFEVTVKAQPYTYDWWTMRVAMVRSDWVSLSSGKMFNVLLMDGSRTSVRLELWG